MLRTAGMKKLREIRGCEEVKVNVKQKPSNPRAWSGELSGFTMEELQRFEAVLRRELCMPKEAVVEDTKEIVIEDEED